MNTSIKVRNRLGKFAKIPQKTYSKLAKKRFFSKVEKTSSCWLWKASLNTYGYGQFSWKNKPIAAHRFSYLLENKNLPHPDLDLDHICRNTKCVNPDHLEAVTHKINMRRGLTNVAAVNYKKTHCINGHEFSEDNIYRKSINKEWRICKKCCSERSKLKYDPVKNKAMCRKYYDKRKALNDGKVPW